MFHKRMPPIGARPGTLQIPEGSPPPRIHVIDYSPAGFREADVDGPEELRPYLSSDSVTWIDVQGFGDEQVMRSIGDVLGMHPLAVEDIVNIPQRAKSEPYDGHLLVIARAPLSERDAALEMPQVCFAVGEGYVASFQERHLSFFESIRERCRAGIGPIWSSGADYLAYALIDAMVDRYYPAAEALAVRLEEVEEEVVSDPGPDCMVHLHQIRRELVVLRRVGQPQREAIYALMHEENPFVSRQTRSYLRDTHDHIAQIMELVDSSRELAVGLTEIYHANASHSANEVMKVLTLMASIFIPLSFVAGVYGMNFDFMPELHHRWAYPILLVTMAAVAVGMVSYFWRKGWIGSRRSRRRH